MLSKWWGSLGMAGPCGLLVLSGVLCLLGAIFQWQWLYPDRADVRHYSSLFRRILLFLIGIILVVAGAVFYLFRDHFPYYAGA